MAITYKSVIADAIADFNGIQEALHDLGATYNNTVITSPISSTGVLIPTNVMDKIIAEQLQVTPSSSKEIIGDLSFSNNKATISLIEAINVTEDPKGDGTEEANNKTRSIVKYASVIIPKATIATSEGKVVISSAGYLNAGESLTNAASNFTLNITDKETSNISIGTLSAGFYPLSTSLTGTFSAGTPGYFTNGTATDSSVIVGRIAAAVPGEYKENSVVKGYGITTAGYIPTGKIIGLGKASSTNATTTNIINTTPGAITLNYKAFFVSGKEQIAINPITDSTKIESKYYIGVNSNTAAGTQATGSISGTVTATESGYISKESNIGSISGTAKAVSTSVNKDFYIPIPAAEHSPSVSLDPGKTTITSVETNRDYFSETKTGFSISAKGSVSATPKSIINGTGWIKEGEKDGTKETEYSTIETKYLKESKFSITNPTISFGNNMTGTSSISKPTANPDGSINNILGVLTTSKPSSGDYLQITADKKSDKSTATITAGNYSYTEGYINAASPTAILNNSTKDITATFNSATYYLPITRGTLKGQSITSSGTVSNTNQGTTITIKATGKKSGEVITAGYLPNNTVCYSDVTLTATDANLLAENIRYGVSIFGVTGSFTNVTDPDASGNQQGAELRYYTVTSDSDDISESHYHSLGMLRGAYAYVDGKLVIGDMNDFSKSNTSKNTYGALGSGTTISMGTPTLKGTTLTATTTSTGYIETGITNISITVPTETKSNTATKSGANTLNASDGKLMTSATINIPDATVSTEGSAAFIANTNAAATDKSSAKLSTTVPSSGNYVKVSAKGTGSLSVTKAGWISTAPGSDTSNAVDAYIPAILGSSYTKKYEGTTITIPADHYIIGDIEISADTGICSINGGSLTLDASPSNATNKSIAKYYATDTAAGSNYVKITANRAAIMDTHTAGYIAEQAATTAISQTSTTAYIKATSSGSVSNDGTTVTNSSIGQSGTTNYIIDETNKKITKTTPAYNVSASGTVHVSSNVKDTYMLVNISSAPSFTVSNRETTLPSTATGSDVDDYVLALYSRMNGYNYTEVEADA